MKRRTFSREFELEAVKPVAERGVGMPGSGAVRESAAPMDARGGGHSAWSTPRPRAA